MRRFSFRHATSAAAPGSPGARRRFPRWLGELGIALAAAVFILAWQGRHLLPSGAPLPDVVLTDLSGHPHALSEYRGRPLVLTFWAPWCPFCKTEVSSLSSLQKSLGPKAAVVSVALAYPDVASVRAFIREHHVDYPVLLGTDATAAALHVNVFPTTYFVDADGHIRHATTGYTSGLGLRLRTWF